ncbi:CbtA family protein [Rhodoplanes sp. TEM]|uniref:CbtA family protein n=1 Tax=Rhodoplanes tepidamans TaxID=200616 RepID=A0ABT5J8F2_RHOTP|nr:MULTISPECIES: CbtA family protein [Rhodoplanes]MDC7785873.1 CbtA family protein [Rhodoplanes tepidamans]MDC7984985.1 CbtA family protein [Rhodoplanes sp. TEM]MDQ0355509.1 putative cobalt transporter CbtA [Rhodoplanes tepidamans]
MVRTLLVRGMLCGILAAVVAFAVAWLIGEPPLERAIGFEAHAEHGAAAAAAAGAPGAAAEPAEVFSRTVQSTVGLMTGLVVLGAAVGGLFGLAFALAQGRLGAAGPRAAAAWLAVAGFVVLVLVPQLKYPAAPPAVGSAETIGPRTALYFILLGMSVLVAVAALGLGRRLVARIGAWNAALAGLGAYMAAMALVMHALPSLGEVPEAFPAAVLWDFRVASLATQAALWAALGLAFGALTERSAARRPIER